MNNPRIINAILLNIKINRPKLVNMYRYKLAIYWQNFTEIILNFSENIAKSFRLATFFDSHCTYKIIRIELSAANKDIRSSLLIIYEINVTITCNKCIPCHLCVYILFCYVLSCFVCYQL